MNAKGTLQDINNRHIKYRLNRQERQIDRRLGSHNSLFYIHDEYNEILIDQDKNRVTDLLVIYI